VKIVVTRSGEQADELVSRLEALGHDVVRCPLIRIDPLGGAPDHPTWYFNVLANPQLELRDATMVKDVTAREVHGDEKALWWARAVEAFPNYAEYQRKTKREIPVFVLE